MASRKEEKERLRKEREERERQEEEQNKKKKRRRKIFGGLGLLILALAIIGFVALSGGGSKGGGAAAEGLDESAGPWQPKTEGLQERQNALGLPATSDTIYHVHAQVKIFINGKPAPVPVNIGVDEDSGFHASFHTHDEKGILHMEAVEPYPFTLGQFFTIWGVKFTLDQLGA
jgi:hypothetical protein